MAASTRPVVASIPVVELDHLDWYRQLGMSHRQRDESAANAARTLQDGDREQQRASRRRWPGIVEAMRQVIRCYNEGAGHEALVVAEEANDKGRDLVVQVVAGGRQTLTMALVGGDLCVSTTPAEAGAADDGRRWITLDEPNDETVAVHALRHWLLRL
jgi:hypothetical protein